MKKAEANQTMDTLKDFLKQIIDENGFKYLSSNAFKIYKKLIDSGTTDLRRARILLLTLLAGVYKLAKEKNADKDKLSAYIQDELFLRKDIADDFASLYTELFSAENISEWDNKDSAGLKEFCGGEWEFLWEGFAVWYASHVHVDCSANAKALLKVSDRKLVRERLKKLVKTNPFISAEKIFEEYNDELCELLDGDFKFYVEAEDYYPPVAEDYGENYEDVLEKFCKKHGFEIIDCEFEGDTSNFEPN
jgi:hypothetical protein